MYIVVTCTLWSRVTAVTKCTLWSRVTAVTKYTVVTCHYSCVKGIVHSLPVLLLQSTLVFLVVVGIGIL